MIPEVVNQIAFEVIGNDMTITMAAEAGQLQLNAFGDNSKFTQSTTANDGLWSSIYLGSQIFRFAALQRLTS